MALESEIGQTARACGTFSDHLHLYPSAVHMHALAVRLVLLSILFSSLAPTPASALLSPQEQIALHEIFLAFPTLAFAPYDGSSNDIWSDKFDHLCVPGNAVTYFGLECTPDGHIGAISFSKHWGRMKPMATFPSLAGLAWVKSLCVALFPRFPHTLCISLSLRSLLLTLCCLTIAFSTLYCHSIVGDFTDEPNLSVPPEFASRVFVDLPLTTLEASRLDMTSYRLISNMTQLKTLSVTQTTLELLNFSGWTHLTSLTLHDIGLPDLGTLMPLVSTLQALDLSSTSLLSVNGLNDFSLLSTISLQFSSGLTSIPLPLSAKDINLVCAPGTCGVESLTIPIGAENVLLSLDSLTSFYIPEGVKSLTLSSVYCAGGYYSPLPSTLESLTVYTAQCDFLDFSTLTRLQSFTINSYAAGFTYAPDLSATIVKEVSMFETNHVNETWLCTLPATLQSITVVRDSQFSAFPSCFQSKMGNLTTLNLAPVSGGAAVTIMTSIGNYITPTNIVHLDFGEPLGIWPAAVSLMTNLKYLRIYSAQLNGAFPNTEIGGLNQLETLYLSHNGLTGTIDNNFFSNHPNLKDLMLTEVGLDGTFPTSDMQNLVNLDIGNTRFTHLPDPIPAATSLQTLFLGASSISNFPSKSAFLSMTSLLEVSMAGLHSFTGGSTLNPGHLADDMPDFWAKHPTLRRFLAGGSGLNGTVPALITAPNLRYLQLANNQLGNYLPQFSTPAAVMQYFAVANNKFIGTIPFSFGNMGFLTLDLSGNKLDRCYQTRHISEATRSMGLQLIILNNNLSGPLPDLSRMGSMSTLDFTNNGFDMCASDPNIQLALSSMCALEQTAQSVTSGEGSACNCNAEFYVPTTCSVDATCPAPTIAAPDGVTVPTSAVGPLCPPPPGEIIAPPFAVVFPCPLPQPQENFFCNGDGTWTSTGSVTQPTLEVPAGSTVVVSGNLTISSSLTFSGVNGAVFVQGCVFITGGQIVVTLTPQEVEQAKHLQKTLIQSSNGNNCDGATDLSQVVVTAKTTKSTCKKVKVNTKDSSTKETLNAVFSIESSSCNTWWIILVSVIGGVLLILIVVALLVTFNETLKSKVRPFWIRTKSASQASNL